MSKKSFEAEKERTRKQVEKVLLYKSKNIRELKKDYPIRVANDGNGGKNYPIWYDAKVREFRYGEARIEGGKLVVYEDWYGNDHEIKQIEVERIDMALKDVVL